jgi:hypothetical protein
LTDLLVEAVEALTKPQTVGTTVKDEDGRWERVHQVTHDALLQRLHDLVWPSGEQNGGAASPASERLPIDVGMLYEYTKISTQITSWIIDAGEPPTRNAIADLDRWLDLVQQKHDFDPGWYVGQLRKWAERIRELLLKVVPWVPEIACPVCKATRWGNMIDGGGRWPVKIEYRLDDNDHITTCNAVCRACPAQWEGQEAVEELLRELAENRAANG